MSKEALDDLKWNYNHNLNRYLNGCLYCVKHPSETDKWLKELLNILNNMNMLIEEIEKYQTVTENEILKGFTKEAIER